MNEVYERHPKAKDSPEQKSENSFFRENGEYVKKSITVEKNFFFFNLRRDLSKVSLCVDQQW